MYYKNNSQKLISVIVPVYNTEDYLPKCFDSILNQTHKNIELILVDDGSTDKSGSICDEYAAKDIRVKVIHQQNSGPVKARREGLEMAEGEYIGFVDSDDWIEPNMYEEMLANLVETNADFVHPGTIRENGNVIKIDYRYDEEVIDFPRNNMKVWTSIMGIYPNIYISRGTASKLFKKSLIQNCLKDVPNDIKLGEDYIATVLCFLRCNRVSLLKKAYYHYVKRNDSLVHVKDVTRMFRVAKLYEELIKIFRSQGGGYLRQINAIYFFCFC